jgi:hypothetical protein
MQLPIGDDWQFEYWGVLKEYWGSPGQGIPEWLEGPYVKEVVSIGVGYLSLR